MKKNIKTLAEWGKSGIGIDKFLQPFDQVDSSLYHRMGSIVCPRFCNIDFIQVGEADSEYGGIYYYATFQHVNSKYYYLGSLPGFEN